MDLRSSFNHNNHSPDARAENEIENSSDSPNNLVNVVGEDGYDLLRSQHTFISSHDSSTPESETYLRSYLKQYICDVQKVKQAKNILVVEDDRRIKNVLQGLIQEENASAQCQFLDSVDDFLHYQQRHGFDLVIVNYYLADDEVDYDFWEQVREDFPGIEVILLSHVNDREYYQMLEKIETRDSFGSGEAAGPLESMTAKMKNFLEHIFGGRNGNQ